MAGLLLEGCALPCCPPAPAEDGRTAPRGMRLEAWEPEADGFTVRTTGAIVRADLRARRITLEQRVGASRPVATLVIGDDLAAILAGAPRRTAFELEWAGAGGAGPGLVIAGDSTLRFREVRSLQVTLDFQPAHLHHRRENDGLLGFDDQGGVAIIPPVASPASGLASTVQGTTWSLTATDPLPVLFVSVCPPRPFDWARAAGPVVHYSSHLRRYPSDAEIAGMAAWARVLELHSWVWKDRHLAAPGYPETYANGEPGWTPAWDDRSYAPVEGRWIPDDEGEFRRVIRTAQALGMKVAPYFGGAMMRAEDVPGEARRLRDTYGVDGLYLDGMPGAPAEEADAALAIARDLRGVFGNEGWLNFHDTHSGYFHPFVQAYVDFVTTSEHLAFDRWTSTTWGMSNAIAGLWPEVPAFFTDPALNVEDAIPMLRRIVDDGRPFHNRLLFLMGEGGQWRFWRLHFTPEELAFARSYALPYP